MNSYKCSKGQDLKLPCRAITALSGCGACRRTKGIGIWKLPASKDDAVSGRFANESFRELTSRTLAKRLRTLANRPKTLNEPLAKRPQFDDANKKWRKDWLNE